jgi:hypothetical protein
MACGPVQSVTFFGTSINVCKLGLDPQLTKEFLEATSALTRLNQRSREESKLDPKLAQKLVDARQAIRSGKFKEADELCQGYIKDVAIFIPEQEEILNTRLIYAGEMARIKAANEVPNVGSLYDRAIQRNLESANALDQALPITRLSVAEAFALRGRTRILARLSPTSPFVSPQSRDPSPFYEEAISRVPNGYDTERNLYRAELLRSLAFTSEVTKVERLATELNTELHLDDPSKSATESNILASYVALFYAGMPSVAPEYHLGGLDSLVPVARTSFMEILIKAYVAAEEIDVKKFPESVDRADFMRTRAFIKWVTGRGAQSIMKSAAEDMQQALEANIAAFGRRTLQVAYTYVLLADMQNNIRDMHGFYASLETARQIGKETLGNENLLEANARFNIAREQYRAAGTDEQRQEATASMENALALSEKLLGSRHPSLFLIEVHLARAYKKAGNIDLASKYYRRTICHQRLVKLGDAGDALDRRTVKEYIEFLNENGLNKDAETIRTKGIECS